MNQMENSQEIQLRIIIFPWSCIIDVTITYVTMLTDIQHNYPHLEWK